jgi:hypothetical protein
MLSIRMLVTVVTAGVLALVMSLGFSQGSLAGGARDEEQEQAPRKPRIEDLSPSGIVVHQDGANQEPAKADVTVDVTSAQPAYSNFCRVTATPEEVILDMGLNLQPFAAGAQQVKVHDRVAMNFYTAKRLMVALEATIRRHEQTFGPIELDVRRRAQSFQRRQAAGDLPK